MRMTLVLATLLALSTSAHAEYIYTYTGREFAGFGPYPGTVSGVYSLQDRITGTLTIDDAATSQYIGGGYSAWPILAYTFTDGHQTLTEQNSVMTNNQFQGDLGAPWADWRLAFVAPTGGLVSGGFGDYGDHAWLGASPTTAASRADENVGAGSIHWTVEHVQPVPEPVTLALLLIGVIGLGVVQKFTISLLF